MKHLSSKDAHNDGGPGNGGQGATIRLLIVAFTLVIIFAIHTDNVQNLQYLWMLMATAFFNGTAGPKIFR